MTTKNQLEAAIDRADQAYYRPGTSAIMPDAAYDALKADLRALDPDSPLLTRVGVRYDEAEIGTKTAHTMPMGSLDNMDDMIAGLPAWDRAMRAKIGTGVNYLLSLKLDGLSVVANYREGVLINACTRGSGVSGDDITANAVLFQQLPTRLPSGFTGSVRGEAVLHRADFEAMMDGLPPEEVSNPRNIGNGLIGRSDGTDSERMRLYAFNYVSDQTEYARDHEVMKLDLLRELGFTPVPHWLSDSVESIAALYDKTLSDRSGLEYEIDGLVITLNLVAHQNLFVTADPKTRLRPKYAKAIKFPTKNAVTTVTGLVVTIGHQGVIVPTLQVERVRCGGVFVDSVIITNYDTPAALDVAVGDKVEIFLAGDIIPNLLRKVEDGESRQPIVEPKVCPSCGSPTTRECRSESGANLYCTDPANCPEVSYRKIIHWMGDGRKGIGILDLGEAMVRALMINGHLANPSDLYLLTPEDIAEVTVASGGRIGLARATTICDNIANKKSVPLDQFLAGLGIELLGSRRVKLLAAAADGRLDTLEQWLDDDNLASLNIPGLGDPAKASVTREAIRAGIRRYRPLVAELLAVGVVPLPLGHKAEQAEGKFTGVSFCFTGTREGLKEVKALGAKIDDDVRKGTTYLVQKDATKATSKSKKAEKLGTRVISVAELLGMIGTS